jgi:hypothetical protein
MIGIASNGHRYAAGIQSDGRQSTADGWACHCYRKSGSVITLISCGWSLIWRKPWSTPSNRPMVDWTLTLEPKAVIASAIETPSLLEPVFSLGGPD